MEIRIEQTVVNALARGAGTYTTLCRDLDAYEPGAVVAAIDRLRARGVVHLGEDRRLTRVEGAVGSSAVEDGHSSDEEMPNDDEPISGEEMPNDDEPAPDEAVAETAQENAASAIRLRRHAVLNSTAISALALEYRVEQDLYDAGIETVEQLVASVGTLTSILDENDAVATVRSLLEASNLAPCQAYGDKDKDALSALSKSVSFYFDWLDVLCTFLDLSCSDDDIRAALKKEQSVALGGRGYSTRHLEGYEPDVDKACAAAQRELLCRSYPLQIDAFETIAMPVIDEAFGMGEVESVEEAARYITSFFEESPSTVRSLMGILEERAARAAASRDRSLEDFVTVGVPGSFAHAAEALAHADDRYMYDSRGRMLRFACR